MTSEQQAQQIIRHIPDQAPYRLHDRRLGAADDSELLDALDTYDIPWLDQHVNERLPE